MQIVNNIAETNYLAEERKKERKISWIEFFLPDFSHRFTNSQKHLDICADSL